MYYNQLLIDRFVDFFIVLSKVRKWRLFIAFLVLGDDINSAMKRIDDVLKDDTKSWQK